MPEQDELRLKVTVDDDGTHVIRGIRGEIDKTKGNTVNATNTMSKGFSNLWTKIAVGGSAILLFKSLTQALTGFDDSFRNVTTLITDATFNISKLEEGLLDLPGEFGDIQSKAEAAYDAISGGVDPANAVKFVGDTAMFAKANIVQLSDAVDVVTTILNTYGDKAGTAAQITDQLTTTIRLGKTRGSELAMSLGQVAGSANTVGISFTDLNASVITMTAGGIKTRQAMTALKAIIANIAQPTEQAKAAAEGMAGGFSIASLKSQGLAQFLKNMTTHVQGNIQAQKDLFGSVEAFNAIAVLTSNVGMKRFINAQQELAKSTDATKEAFEKQQQTFSAAYATIKNEAQAAFVKALLPTLRDLATYFKENRGEIVGFVKVTVGGIGEVVKVLVSLKDIIALAGKAWLTYFAASKILPILSQMKTGIFGVTSAINTMNMATQAGNVQTIASFGGMVNYMKTYQTQTAAGNAAFLQIMGSTQNAIANTSKGLGGMVNYMQSSQSVGTKAFTAVKNSVNSLNDKLTALPTAAKIGLGALALDIGWKIGSWINDALELEKHVAKISKYEITVAFDYQAYKAGLIDLDKQSETFLSNQEKEIERITKHFKIQADELYRNKEAFNSLSDYAQKYYRSMRTQDRLTDIEAIKKLGAEIGVSSNSLKEHALAIYKNDAEFKKLTESQQKIVEGFVKNNLEIIVHKNYLDSLRESVEKNYAAYVDFSKMLGVVFGGMINDGVGYLNNLGGAFSSLGVNIKGVANLFGGEFETAFRRGKETQDQVNEKISKNIGLYNSLKATVGNYTTEALEKELKEKKELNELTEDQVKQLEELHKSYQSLAGEMGILTRQGYVELTQKAGMLSTIWKTEQSQIINNQDKLEKLTGSLKGIIPQYEAAGKKIPQWLKELSERTEEWGNKQKIALATMTLTMSTASPSWFSAMGGAVETITSAFVNGGQAALDYNSAFTRISEQIGILSDEKITQLNTEVSAFNDVLKGGEESIRGNVTQTQKLKEMAEAISTTYIQSGKIIPPEIQNIIDKTTIWTLEQKKLAGITLQLMPMLSGIGGMLLGYGKEVDDTKDKTDNLSQGFLTLAQTGDIAIGALEKMGIISGDMAGVFKGVTGGVNAFGAGLQTWKKSGSDFEGILGKISSGIGMFSGALSVGVSMFNVFSSLLSGKSGELEAAERILWGLGDAAEGYAEQIEELAKELDKAGGAEEAFNSLFDDIIKDTKITTENLDTFIAKIQEMPAVAQWGSASWTQVSEDYDNAIMAILEDTQRLGKEGSRSFTDLIRNSRELGLELEGVSNYISGVLNSGVESWKNYVSTLDTTTIGENFAFVEQSALSLMSALSKEGKNIIEIVGIMGPQLSDLATMATESGIQVSAGLQQMLDISKFTSSHKELYDRINATVGIMDALGDSVYVLDTDFYGFSTQVQQQFREIITLTGDQNLALRLMAPSLMEIIDLSEGHGFVIDENTQALIDQAKEAGVSLENQKTDQEVLNETLGITNQILLGIAEGFGVKIPDGVREMVRATQKGVSDMTGDLGRLQGGISDTVDSIGSMSTAIRKADDDFADSIYRHSMTDSLGILQDKLTDTVDTTLSVGQSIIPVHNIWVNSTAKMAVNLENVQNRMKELENIIGSYGKKLTETQQAEKAAHEAELANLQAVIDAREETLKLSEQLNSISFDVSSFDAGINNIYGVFDALRSGVITTTEAMDEAGNSFSTMIENARNLGIEGSSSIQKFVNSTKKIGLDVPEISKYIGDQLTGGVGALGDYLETFTGTGVIKDKIKELNESLLTAKRKEKAGILKEIEEQRAALVASTADVEQNFQSMSTYTMGFFNSMIKEGATFMEAMGAMGPQLSDMATIARDNGMKVGGSLKEMLNIQSVIDQYPKLMTRIDSTTKMMEAFGNSGYMTFDLLKQFQLDTASQFDSLTEKTGNVRQAYQLLAPQLGKLLWYSQQQGVQLDANTKAMIAEAQQHGINMSAMIPPQEKMVFLMETLVTAMGVDIPYAMEEMAGAATDNLGAIESQTENVKSAITGLSGEMGDKIAEKSELMKIYYQNSLTDMAQKTGEMGDPLRTLGENIENLPKIQVTSNITDLTGSTQIEFGLIQEAALLAGTSVKKFAGDSVEYISGISQQVGVLFQDFEAIPGYTEYARSAIESFASSAAGQIQNVNTQLSTLLMNFSTLTGIELPDNLKVNLDGANVSWNSESGEWIKAASGYMGWINKPTPFLIGEGGEKEFVSVIPESQMKSGSLPLREPTIPQVTVPSLPVSSVQGGNGISSTNSPGNRGINIDRIVISPTIIVNGGDSERDITEKWFEGFKRNTYYQKETIKIIAEKLPGEMNG